MKIIKEEISPIVIDVRTEIQVKEKINLDFMRKLFICLIDQNLWIIRLRDKKDMFYEIITWSIEDYVSDLKSFKEGLKLCNKDINYRINNYSWNISFYRKESSGYDYNIIYYMSRPNILIINGYIHKDTYERIKNILSFDSIDEYIDKYIVS